MAYLNEATKQIMQQLRLKGGVSFRTLDGAVACDAKTEQFCFWDPGGANRDVTLGAEESSEGLFHFFVNEANAAENLVIKDDAGNTIVTINQGEWAFVACDGTTWRDASSSAFADILAAANIWLAAQALLDTTTFEDPAARTKKARLDVEAVTAGQTRVITVPDTDVDLGDIAKAVEQIVPMAVLGAWAFDGDGANTNGGGLVGATPTLTEALIDFAKVDNGGVIGNLSAVNAGYAATYQLFPDAPEADADFALFGGAVKFPELAFDMGTVATFDAAGVLVWQYWNGATWSALTIAHDGTSASTDGGTLAFGRDGAVTFVPPADWASTTVGGQAAFWIRVGIAAGKAANLTQVPITNTKEHELVTPNGGFVSRHTGTITTLRLVDNAATLHTTADVKFVLHNFTTGANTGALTFAQDVRAQRWTGLTLAVAAGDVLGVVCTQEDGTAEPSGVMFELGITVS